MNMPFEVESYKMFIQDIFSYFPNRYGKSLALAMIGFQILKFIIVVQEYQDVYMCIAFKKKIAFLVFK